MLYFKYIFRNCTLEPKWNTLLLLGDTENQNIPRRGQHNHSQLGDIITTRGQHFKMQCQSNRVECHCHSCSLYFAIISLVSIHVLWDIKIRGFFLQIYIIINIHLLASILKQNSLHVQDHFKMCNICIMGYNAENFLNSYVITQVWLEFFYFVSSISTFACHWAQTELSYF